MSFKTITSVFIWFMVLTSCHLPDHANRKPSVLVKDLKNRSESLIHQSAFSGVIDVTQRDADSLFWLAYSSSEDQSVTVASGKDALWKDVLTIHPDHGNSVRISHPRIWMDPDGKLWIFWTKQIVYSSRTDNEIWALTGDPDANDLIRSKPFFISDGILMGKPVLLSNGKFILPAGKDHHVRTITSLDHGKTWSHEGEVELAEDTCIHGAVCTIVECLNGSLWMNIQTPESIWESRSTDRAMNWSKLVSSNIAPAGLPFFVQQLISGNLLLVKKADALTAYISVDCGQTWKGELILDESAHVSHITGHQLKDLVFPCCSEISIIFAVQKDKGKEIRMESFTEDDVMAGQKHHYSSPFR